MAIHRYWRLTGFGTRGGEGLNLSEIQIYGDGVAADTSTTISATSAPSSGSLADLRDGNTATSVIWSSAEFTQPGFSINWDFGVGAGAEDAAFRLGSGLNEAGYPLEATCQFSDDGSYWSTRDYAVTLTYPGTTTLTAVPTLVSPDPSHATTALLIRDAIADDSAAALSVTNLGGVSVTSTATMFGDTALYFDGTGGLTVPSSLSLCKLGGDFTLEAWVYIADSSKRWLQLIDARVSGASGAPWVWTIEAEEGGVYKLCFFDGTYMRAATAIPVAQRIHVATTRSGSTLKHFLDGVLIGTHSLVGDVIGTASSPLSIGGKDIALYKFKGYIDGLRINNGICRYSFDFTPEPFADVLLVLPVGAYLPRVTAGVIPGTPLVSPLALEIGAAETVPEPVAFFDVYNGGIGSVTGTVKEKNTPANTPLRRRVLLVDEASRMTIRETWSDPVTGAFEFRGVKQGVKYSTISYDHLHNYRAVIADNQDAT